MRRLAALLLLALTIAWPGPLAVTFNRGAPDRFYHSDAQGSRLAFSNSAGVVGARERYAPFGESLLNGAGMGNFITYTGHMRDVDTGLTYMQARFYDPVIGRFLSTDPIGYQDQLNLYAYVANDPVNKVDPNGEIAVPVAVAACAASAPCAAAAIGAAAVLATAAAKGLEAAATAIHNAANNSNVGRGGDGRILAPTDNGGPTSDPEPNRPAPIIPDFTQHGAERADERGIPATVVGDALMNPDGVSTPGDNDTTIFHNAENNVTAVVSNATGSVVTTHRGVPGGAEGQAIREQLPEKEPK